MAINIVNVTNINGKTVGAPLTAAAPTPAQTVLQNPGAPAAEKLIKVNSVYVANVDGSTAVDVTAYFYDASATPAATSYRVANTISVPADATLVLIDKTAPLYLEQGDKLDFITSDATSGLEVVISYEEIS